MRHKLDRFALGQEGDTLTLEIEDGRRLDGFMNGDMFVATGQLTSA